MRTNILWLFYMNIFNDKTLWILLSFNFFIFLFFYLFVVVSIVATKEGNNNYWTHQPGRTTFRFSVEINLLHWKNLGLCWVEWLCFICFVLETFPKAQSRLLSVYWLPLRNTTSTGDQNVCRFHDGNMGILVRVCSAEYHVTNHHHPPPGQTDRSPEAINWKWHLLEITRRVDLQGRKNGRFGCAAEPFGWTL